VFGHFTTAKIDLSDGTSLPTFLPSEVKHALDSEGDAQPHSKSHQLSSDVVPMDTESPGVNWTTAYGGSGQPLTQMFCSTLLENLRSPSHLFYHVAEMKENLRYTTAGGRLPFGNTTNVANDLGCALAKFTIMFDLLTRAHIFCSYNDSDFWYDETPMYVSVLKFGKDSERLYVKSETTPTLYNFRNARIVCPKQMPKAAVFLCKHAASSKHGLPEALCDALHNFTYLLDHNANTFDQFVSRVTWAVKDKLTIEKYKPVLDPIISAGDIKFEEHNKPAVYKALENMKGGDFDTNKCINVIDDETMYRSPFEDTPMPSLFVDSEAPYLTASLTEVSDLFAEPDTEAMDVT